MGRASSNSPLSTSHESTTRAQLEAARRELERAKTDLVETLASSSGRDGPPASFVDALGDIQFLWFADHRSLGAAASVSKHWNRLAAAPGLWGSLVEARWPLGREIS